MIRNVIQGVTQIQPNFLRQCTLTSTLRAVTSCDTQSIHPPFPFSQQIRTTYIVKRKNPLSLSKMHNRRSRLMKGRNYIYELVEDTNVKKQDPVKVILLSSVEGVGSKGKIVDLSPGNARHHLLMGSAVYASPENIEKYADLKDEAGPEDEPSSPYAARTAAYLSRLILNVSMNIKNPWKIEAWHIRVAFRRAGIIVPEECITLPSKPIEGPDLSIQNKEFLVKVKINNKEEVPVRSRVMHYTTVKAEQLPLKHLHFLYPAEPLFPEDAHILEELTRKHPHTIYEEDD